MIQVLSHRLSCTQLDTILNKSQSDEVHGIIDQFFNPGKQISYYVINFDNFSVILHIIIFLHVEEQRLDAIDVSIDHVFVLLGLLNDTYIVVAEFIEIFYK